MQKYKYYQYKYNLLLLSYFFSSIAFYAGWRSQASSFNMASSMALHFHRQSTTIEREFAPKLQHREWQNFQDLHRVPVAGRVAFKMQVLELICQQTGLQGAVYILFENSQHLKKNAGIKVELSLVKLYFHVDRALIRCYSLFNFLFQLKQNMFTCCNNRRCEN